MQLICYTTLFYPSSLHFCYSEFDYITTAQLCISFLDEILLTLCVTNVMKDPLLIARVILRCWSIKNLIFSSLSRKNCDYYADDFFDVSSLQFISIFLVTCAIFFWQIRFAISKYGKDCLRKSCRTIKISKSSCYIQVLVVMVTI